MQSDEPDRILALVEAASGDGIPDHRPVMLADPRPVMLAHQRLVALAPDLAILAHDAVEALQTRLSEQSGHFLDCQASEEIIHFQEAQPGSCTCAPDLAILAAYDALEGGIPEVRGG